MKLMLYQFLREKNPDLCNISVLPLILSDPVAQEVRLVLEIPKERNKTRFF